VARRWRLVLRFGISAGVVWVFGLRSNLRPPSRRSPDRPNRSAVQRVCQFHACVSTTAPPRPEIGTGSTTARTYVMRSPSSPNPGHRPNWLNNTVGTSMTLMAPALATSQFHQLQPQDSSYATLIIPLPAHTGCPKGYPVIGPLGERWPLRAH